MRLIPTFVPALHGVPRRSEGEREFDALMHELTELEPPPTPLPHDETVHVVREPWEGPARDVVRRAHHH